ncbi:uncharacterized protein BT62DRAFT_1010211 [Guyanagaster necrorhizus]|uniref:Uncharacterized protein n=1 Tax=Guyanagaster necrorhizus TaxID=856835 RepID=A0A9P7VL85_9AGAR|nr:uncharacterized protein BT62DRAFT_1010211 [Guyanagaster necrorhizus MCA 3950]KAG7442600.1 hypothetical protein BT62DRAFT_1010211 [Guyanagaster necrorhizus MCA 3950]
MGDVSPLLLHSRELAVLICGFVERRYMLPPATLSWDLEPLDPPPQGRAHATAGPHELNMQLAGLARDGFSIVRHPREPAARARIPISFLPSSPPLSLHARLGSTSAAVGGMDPMTSQASESGGDTLPAPPTADSEEAARVGENTPFPGRGAPAVPHLSSEDAITIEWGGLSDGISRVWKLIGDKLQPYGSRFSFVGEVLDAEFMVVMQSAVFRKGYKGMEPAKIPQFKEGERDKVAKKLVEEGTERITLLWWHIRARDVVPIEGTRSTYEDDDTINRYSFGGQGRDKTTNE